ncbi:hypothetical protein JR316_0009502 [Psilocybe cubensis]|uniref:Uncharacterized protein n=2 Tax=Psilocybe cubensis TaxID=181762 RepID=A0ACB8GP21_PSICU|nr:hypothetical protein JR316_0009502 [Psilocybe cubensis]KAH9477298.1 hypothetical protein JR316_0009502 [Psilocybe cubensis]
MSLHPECSENSVGVGSSLPVEIGDRIVREACEFLDDRDLASIALVSHMFRIRANEKRFASLVIHRDSGEDIHHTAERVKLLADIIECQKELTLLKNIVDFATSFTLRMISMDDKRALGDESMSVVDNTRLAYIFRNLFRASNHPPSAFFTLSLNYGRMRWSAMSSEMQAAFHDLLSQSSITRLELHSVEDIPRDWLCGTKIKDLHIRRVRVRYDRDSMPVDGTIQLKSLDCDDFVDPASLARMTGWNFSSSSRSAKNQLTSVTRLHIYTENINTLGKVGGILDNTPSLESLAFTLKIPLEKYSNMPNRILEIDLRQLPRLKEVSFICGIAITFRTEVSLVQPNLIAIRNVVGLTFRIPSRPIAYRVYNDCQCDAPMRDTKTTEAFDGINFCVWNIDGELSMTNDYFGNLSHGAKENIEYNRENPVVMDKMEEVRLYLAWSV